MSAARGAFGGLFFIAGIFLSIWIIGTIAPGLLIFLLFPVLGLMGGFMLGFTNPRSIRHKESRKDELITYGLIMFFAIVFLGLYYFIFGDAAVAKHNASDLDNLIVVAMGMASGVLVELGFALVVGTAFAD